MCYLSQMALSTHRADEAQRIEDLFYSCGGSLSQIVEDIVNIHRDFCNISQHVPNQMQLYVAITKHNTYISILDVTEIADTFQNEVEGEGMHLYKSYFWTQRTTERINIVDDTIYSEGANTSFSNSKYYDYDGSEIVKFSLPTYEYKEIGDHVCFVFSNWYAAIQRKDDEEALEKLERARRDMIINILELAFNENRIL